MAHPPNGRQPERGHGRILALLNTRTENVLELQHFEDLPLGGEWTTRRRTLTEADVAAFVGLSGDYNPLYVDDEHARTAQYGARIAPGTLIAALTSGLGSMDVPIPATVGLVGMSWKFTLPVQPGDTLVTRWRLSRKRNVENPRWGLAVWQVEVENQRGELVASAEMARLVAKREQPVERTGRSRRRRRKGAPAGQSAADVVLAEPVPEPAPADVPPPASRRRRRRGAAEPGEASEQPPAAAEPPASEPSEPQQPAPAASPEAPAPRRRRRRRPSNGQDDGRQEGEGRPETPDAHILVATPAAPAETAAPASSDSGPFRPAETGTRSERPDDSSSGPPGNSSSGPPEPAPGAQAEPRPAGDALAEGGGDPSEGGLGRVFRRLLRP